MPILPFVRSCLIPILLLASVFEGKIVAQDQLGNESHAAAKVRVPVGMVGKVSQIVIPGGELEAVPNSDPLAKIIVRVAESYRHGDAYRYDLEFTGFEPGRYDLAKSLRLKIPDTSPVTLPPVEVEIVSVLEPGKIEPSRPARPEIDSWWTYWTKLNIFVGLWIAGLAGLFHWSNRVKKVETVSTEVITPVSLSQRLKPLVTAACEGSIAPHQRAELESLLIAYWTSRSDACDEVSPGRILSKLKQHPDAGPLLKKLEQWLHMPPGQGQASEREIAQLLKPYESLQDFEIPGITDTNGKR
ncbi:hypothetical protein GC170_09785 [bacterium]|nr:hypothetical protein [bacterium]